MASESELEESTASESELEESMASESELEESVASEESELEEEDDNDDDIFNDYDDIFDDYDEPNDGIDLAERMRTAISFHINAEYYFRIVLIPDDAPENRNQEGDDDQNTEVWYNVLPDNLQETKFEMIIQKTKRNIMTIVMKKSEESVFRKMMQILHGRENLAAINLQRWPRLVAVASKWRADFLVANLMEKILNRYEDLRGELAIIPCSAVRGMLFLDDEVIVESEDTIYRFLKQWIAEAYPDRTSSDLSEINFIERFDFIRFNYMSLDMLEEILHEDNMLFTRNFTEKAVSNAKCYKKSIPSLLSLPPQMSMRQYKVVPLRIVDRLHSLSIFVVLTKRQVLNLLPLRTEQFCFYGGTLVIQLARMDNAEEEHFGLSVKTLGSLSSKKIYICTAWVLNGEHKEWKLELEIESDGYKNLISWKDLFELDGKYWHYGYLYLNVEIKAIKSPWRDT